MEAKKITRDVLRKMRANTSVTVECVDGYDMDSQKNTAYAMQRLIPYKFSCHAEGLMLTIKKTKA
jgi:hypothetical protein